MDNFALCILNFELSMVLKHLELQNFRNYTKALFNFNPRITIIVGPNASGKTNLLESVWLLATGKGRGSEKEQLVRFNETICKVKGSAQDTEADEMRLEVLLHQASPSFLQRKYLINGVSRRRADFAGTLPAVLFTPIDLEIVIGAPGNRRRFLDEVLEQTDIEYSVAIDTYGKALRQRNALLEHVRETGRRKEEQFAYWDEVLIQSGQQITSKRKSLISYINEQEKQLFSYALVYDTSEISSERLARYKEAEVGAGVTLVGPHRDDVIIRTNHPISGREEDVKLFSSRGQQRLVVLELRLAQISYIKQQTGREPVLLLDDIFSELDSNHIGLVLQQTNHCQTIISTTHEEFISLNLGMKENVIHL